MTRAGMPKQQNRANCNAQTGAARAHSGTFASRGCLVPPEVQPPSMFNPRRVLHPGGGKTKMARHTHTQCLGAGHPGDCHMTVTLFSMVSALSFSSLGSCRSHNKFWRILLQKARSVALGCIRIHRKARQGAFKFKSIVRARNSKRTPSRKEHL